MKDPKNDLNKLIDLDFFYCYLCGLRFNLVLFSVFRFCRIRE